MLWLVTSLTLGHHRTCIWNLNRRRAWNEYMHSNGFKKPKASNIMSRGDGSSSASDQVPEHQAKFVLSYIKNSHTLHMVHLTEEICISTLNHFRKSPTTIQWFKWISTLTNSAHINRFQAISIMTPFNVTQSLQFHNEFHKQ